MVISCIKINFFLYRASSSRSTPYSQISVPGSSCYDYEDDFTSESDSETPPTVYFPAQGTENFPTRGPRNSLLYESLDKRSENSPSDKLIKSFGTISRIPILKRNANQGKQKDSSEPSPEKNSRPQYGQNGTGLQKRSFLLKRNVPNKNTMKSTGDFFQRVEQISLQNYYLVSQNMKNHHF